MNEDHECKWYVSSAVCQLCSHTWTAVYCACLDDYLQCPDCKVYAGEPL